MSIIISSFFTKNGIPQSGLTPTIRIWEVSGGSHDLLVGSPNGSTQSVDGNMIEVADIGSDGFYKFEFTEALGFDKNKTFVARSNGGTSLSFGERFQVVGMNPSEALDVAGISSAVWDAQTVDYNDPGTFGAEINSISSTTQSIAVAVTDCQILLDILLKYETNRTKIDPVAKTLTVYDDNCTTPLRVFQLLDSTGTPSVESVCERKPISATDGAPVCP